MSQSLLDICPAHVLDSEGRSGCGGWVTLREAILSQTRDAIARATMSAEEKAHQRKKTRRLMREVTRIGWDFKMAQAA